MLVSADDVRGVSFTVSRKHEGYDMQAVDRFLDQVEETLLRWADACQQAAEASSRGHVDALPQRPQVLTPDTAEAVRFPTGRWRQTYAIDQVDGFIDDVVETLHACEQEWTRLTQR